MNPDYLDLQKNQEEYFQLLDEIFCRTIGCKFNKFCNIDAFAKDIRKWAKSQKKVDEIEKGLLWGYDELHKYYSKDMRKSFNLAKKLGGVKLVLGGTSRFNLSHFNSVRKMLLYADTIFIPDPVLPWIEIDRREERFRDMLFLETIFTLLHLKPLVTANLTYPAILVFQSWEKLLELKDEQTRLGIEALALNFISYYTGEYFESPEELMRYLKENEADFLTKIESKNLFIAPGQETGNNIANAILIYKNSIKEKRSSEFTKAIEKMSDAELGWLGIKERLAPQFHLLENSEELQCQPMLCLDVHWHYYTLCSQIYEDKLRSINLLKPETVSTIRSLNDPRFKWLGNIPINELVELRKSNENEDFRRKLSEHTNQLYEAGLNNLDKIANEVSRAISSLLAEHQNKIQQIEEEYNKKHIDTLKTTLLTAPALFVPTLAPFTGILQPLAIAGKYGLDKIQEIKDKKKAAKSLTGVLAKAAEKTYLVEE